MLTQRYSIVDLDTLPRYQNYEALISYDKTIDLKEKYRPLIFFMVFVGSLGHESTLYRAMDAARFVLRNPRVGMIVLGDGPAKREFEHRAKILDIEQQVIFETRTSNIIPYLKSANMLIVTDTDMESEEVVLKGAASGIPMVMARTEKRDDVFVHGESAFLCESDNVQAFTDRIDDLLNNIDLRKQFVSESQKLITKEFHSNPEEYLRSYRLSIEQAFFVDQMPATAVEEEE